MVRDALDRLCINDNFSKRNEIRNEFTDFNFSVVDWIPGLLRVRNSMKLEINHKSFLIRLFVISVADCIEHIEGATNNLLGFQNMNPISSICVHPVYLRLVILQASSGPSGWRRRSVSQSMAVSALPDSSVLLARILSLSAGYSSPMTRAKRAPDFSAL